MPEMTLDQTVDSMITPTSQRLDQLAAAMQGTGAEAWQHLKQLTEITHALPAVGRTAADKITALRADPLLGGVPHHRSQLIAEQVDLANVTSSKLHEAATTHVKALESSLTTGLLPHPMADAAERMLIRDEVRNRLAGKSDRYLAAQDILGSSPAHDAELLGSFGASLFSEKQHAALRDVAVEKYLERSGGTSLQQASRRALKTFHAAQIAAAPTAGLQASRMYTEFLDSARR